MTAKLHIDMSQGIMNLEGEPEFVKEIYRDFKDYLATGLSNANAVPSHGPTPPAGTQTELEAKPKAKPRAAVKKKTDSAESVSGVNSNAPKLDKNIDLSGLSAFYGQYDPKNNAEKILIFVKYISEELGIEEPNTDQVYTLFKKTGEKIPKAFAQAFHDTGNKRGFIDFNGPLGTVKITIAGDNHFNHDLKKKAVE